MLSKREEEFKCIEKVVELQVSTAKLGERVIFLVNSNEEIKKSCAILQKEIENRFRWTIGLFIMMLALFTGMMQLLMRLNGIA